MAKGGFALDAKAAGFGLITLSYHAAAVHVSPITDNLYLVLDFNDEPVDEMLPLPSTAVTPTGNTIFQFNGDEDSRMVYRWRGRLNQMPFPVAFKMAQVRGKELNNLVFRIYRDGVLLKERLISNIREFVLPKHEATDEYELELVGTARAQTMQAAEDVMELT